MGRFSWLALVQSGRTVERSGEREQGWSHLVSGWGLIGRGVAQSGWSLPDTDGPMLVCLELLGTMGTICRLVLRGLREITILTLQEYIL